MKKISLVPSGKKNLSYFYLAFSLYEFIKKKKIETRSDYGTGMISFFKN